MKIRDKIFVSTAVSILVISALISIFISRQGKNAIIAETSERAIELGEILAYVAVAGIINGDLLELQGMVETIDRREEVVSVHVIDTKGVILVSYDIEQIGQIHALYDMIAFNDDLDMVQSNSYVNEDRGIVTSVVPVYSMEDILGYAVTDITLQFAYARLYNLRKALLVVSVSSLLLALALLYFVAARITAPVRTLVETVKSFGRGQKDTRSDYQGRDEVGELSREFNQMAVNVSRLEQDLIHKEKLSALGVAAAAVAHEVKTPIATLSATVERMLLENFDQHALDRFRMAMLEDLKKLNRLVNDLLAFSRKEALEKSKVGVPGLVDMALQYFERDITAKQLQVTRDFRMDRGIYADFQKLQRVIMNLIDNAVKASVMNGALHIAVSGEGEVVHIQVSDTGIGIPDDIKDTIFEPFVSGFKGTGLGLAICKDIIQLHKGTIEVQSAKGAGTTFHIRLPAEYTS